MGFKIFIFALISIILALLSSVKCHKNRQTGIIVKKKYGMHTVGSLTRMINDMAFIPSERDSKPFRTPCLGDHKCPVAIQRLYVPNVVQLENSIMGLMRDIAKVPPGFRLPDKYSKTEPLKLLLDKTYREDACIEDVESCLKENKRKMRVLKKLFFKKYNPFRETLIGYGGKGIWGGDGNLFYRR